MTTPGSSFNPTSLDHEVNLGVNEVTVKYSPRGNTSHGLCIGARYFDESLFLDAIVTNFICIDSVRPQKTFAVEEFLKRYTKIIGENYKGRLETHHKDLDLHSKPRAQKSLRSALGGVVQKALEETDLHYRSHLSYHRRQKSMGRFPNTGLADMHLIYRSSERNARAAERLYHERYTQKGAQDRQMFTNLHQNLIECGSLRGIRHSES
ncbi:hypothetical protein TNCV_2398321 [Trichonephila clavipes]|uniref:Uncharacterized protein n=1 Tax=Trichonephila clavipes TaxID=2585209 RepID=A0A8X6VHA7_TRICX|nr:hypothetical protein TNCV_2398321 [Trichonephila clavipes]